MIDRIFHSERYLGANKNNHFEGWYFRISGGFPFALIVGVSRAENDPHSFVQYIDGVRSAYCRFGIEDFSFRKENMTIRIAGNSFSFGGINARLTDNGREIAVSVGFSEITTFQKSFYAPSVMGPFSYLPMFCNHAVISPYLKACGTLTVGHEKHTVDGSGYIEKDFGTKFPENYLWAQAFCGKTSFMSAIAWPLPLVKRGFLCLILHENKQYNLSLYTGAKLKIRELTAEKACFSIHKGNHFAEIDITNNGGAQMLKAPAKDGKMTISINENLCADLKMRLRLNNQEIPLPALLPCAFESVMNPRSS